MSGRSQSKLLQSLGVIAALVGLVGYVVFGWRFGEGGGVVPNALGVAFALVAVVWTMYRRL
ncbi:hypothetical protein [Halospeciosus flavus]|uniref:Uncharacterized protein n=1 Tax=Halospeciosus flavus TaxID=3032283 RepID=A0ABD5Z3K5_9EURY|nr:hypothetical protein [Halospeciosus flavus]